MQNSFPIIVIDDDPFFSEVVRQVLLHQGYEVIVSNDAAEALDIIQTTQSRMILCDWMMPDLSGLEVIQLLRSCDKQYRYFILMTAKNSSDEVVAGLSAGADDYVTKPINKIELLARIQCGMRIISQQQEIEEQNVTLKSLAEKDELTGAYNRRYFNQALSKEIRRARRYQQPLSLILADIDHFKNINDQWGHQAGDDILTEYCSIQQGELRFDVDWVARYGGEEFVIVLPNTSHLKALQVAEKLRQKVELNSFVTTNVVLNVTSSYGIATLDETSSCDLSDEFSSLLKRADERLYQSKARGRNQCTGVIHALKAMSA
ncbi:MAG: diguanylate cyclase response regulator [Kangiellaceae bacterium]|nr:diguanylate cyclase response regulator [Kangiellaceae bacterium]|tara:strand:- start:8248 stop:9201 length:954 start_codon:yes stop_codon:yes gene_type:complete